MQYNTQFKHLIALCFAMASVFSYAQSVKTTKMTQEQLKVLGTVERMTAAFQAKNIDEVMRCYESHAVIMFEPTKPISDPAIAREMFSAMAAMNPVFTYSGHEVFISGNIATHLAPWNMKAHDPEGNEIQQRGLSIAVLRKQKDGSWLMIQDNPHGQFLLNQ